MSDRAQAIDAEGQADELTFEPLGQQEGNPALGLIMESLRRRQPERTIR
jgi:hypothetical protein